MRLRGLCWDHERCVAPMRAAAASWRERHGVEIVWDARPLAAFNDQPASELSDRYDLLFIDHPSIGAAAEAGALTPLDDLLGEEQLGELAAGAVGPSHDSYAWAGRQWALATDAACHVAAVQGDLEPPVSWPEVLELARRAPGTVALPLYPSDAICALLTIQAGMGRPFDPRIGFDAGALAVLVELVPHLHPISHGGNPPAVLERMRAGEIAYVPLTFGYTSYARELRFTGIPGGGGAILGGAGLAVSAASRAPDQAAAFAAWVSGAEAQCTIVARHGGQPGHRAAWEDPELDGLAGGFFSGTRATIEAAWVRPREPWWPDFQRRAGERLAAALAGDPDPARLAAELDAAIPTPLEARR